MCPHRWTPKNENRPQWIPCGGVSFAMTVSFSAHTFAVRTVRRFTVHNVLLKPPPLKAVNPIPCFGFLALVFERQSDGRDVLVFRNATPRWCGKRNDHGELFRRGRVSRNKFFNFLSVCSCYRLPSNKSTTQHPRTCSPACRQWFSMSSLLQSASCKASARMGMGEKSRLSYI